MTGLGSPVNVSEGDFAKTLEGKLPVGTPIGCGYRFAQIQEGRDCYGRPEKRAVYLRRCSTHGIDRINLSQGVFGPSGWEGPVSNKDPNYEVYEAILKTLQSQEQPAPTSQ